MSIVTPYNIIKKNFLFFFGETSKNKHDSLVKSRIGERHCPFRKKGFDTGGVKNSKLFEELATSSWNLVAGVETPERGHRSEPI